MRLAAQQGGGRYSHCEKIFLPQLEVPAPELAGTEAQRKALVNFGHQPDVQGIYEVLVAGLRPREVVRSMS